MRIVKEAFAGTLESSDCLVKIAPHDSVVLNVTSTVLGQYGDQIRATVLAALEQLGVEGCQVSVEDKGALDFALRARVQAAVQRATDEPWDWSRL